MSSKSSSKSCPDIKSLPTSPEAEVVNIKSPEEDLPGNPGTIVLCYMQAPGFKYSSIHDSWPWESNLSRKEIGVGVKTPRSGDEDDEMKSMPQEECHCRFCFYPFTEDDDRNVVKMKCKCCKFTLSHEECEIANNNNDNKKCNVCDEDIEKVQVYLSWANFASPLKENKKKINRGSFFDNLSSEKKEIRRPYGECDQKSIIESDHKD